MKGRQTHNIPPLMESRKYLRNNATPEEMLLWEELKNSKTGYKFRRQHSIENMIVDFYCSEKKTAVELDGAHHFTKEGKDYDAQRTEILNHHGITVIRFTNSEITKDVKSVIKRILQHINKV